MEHSSAGPLFASGNPSLLLRPGVAIIGSRAASLEALRLARSVAASLCTHGLVIVSGLATGIDSAAHEGAVSSRGYTIAVIGTGLDRAYPAENARLQECIYRDHLLVSPFAAGSQTAPWHFPARNRVIAQLSSAVVLVEADEKSGTRHVIEECARLGRPVFVRSDLLPRLSWLPRAEARTTVTPWNPAGTANDNHERLSSARYAVPFDALAAAIATASTSRAP